MVLQGMGSTDIIAGYYTPLERRCHFYHEGMGVGRRSEEGGIAQAIYSPLIPDPSTYNAFRTVDC